MKGTYLFGFQTELFRWDEM